MCVSCPPLSLSSSLPFLLYSCFLCCPLPLFSYPSFFIPLPSLFLPLFLPASLSLHRTFTSSYLLLLLLLQLLLLQLLLLLLSNSPYLPFSYHPFLLSIQNYHTLSLSHLFPPLSLAFLPTFLLSFFSCYMLPSSVSCLVCSIMLRGLFLAGV